MVTDFFLSVFAISVSVSLIVILLLLLSPLLDKRYAAKWKYWIWIFLALRLLLPYSWGGGRPAADIVRQTERQELSQGREGDSRHPSGQTVPLRRIMVQIPEPLTTPFDAQGKGDGGVTVLDIIADIWITVSLILLGTHLISYFYYRYQVQRRGKRMKAVPVMQQVYELKRELHIRPAVHVVEYSEASSPMMIGFLHPVLILPDENYDAENLFFILKHELIHWKRKDVYIKLLLAAANAVHWFNPLIWIMQKEAVIDMELSCDERVTQGAGYAECKAYTEALLSTIHKQCAKKNMISTQFYGGKQIMKKRFQNILSRTRKKNGAAVLVCAMILTISLGTMIGCSAAKDNTVDSSRQDTVADMAGNDGQDAAVDTAGNDRQDAAADMAGNGAQGAAADTVGNGGQGAGRDTAGSGQNRTDDSSAENAQDRSFEENGASDTMTLTIMKEGEPEEKQAVLAVEEGYSLYLPEGEWQKNSEGIWQAAVNEDVCIWVERYDREQLTEQFQLPLGTGIVTIENTPEDGNVSDADLANMELTQTDGGLVYHEKLYGDGSNVWCVFYCYPEEAEEGWGRELPVIADTFAVTVSE